METMELAHTKRCKSAFFLTKNLVNDEDNNELFEEARKASDNCKACKAAKADKEIVRELYLYHCAGGHTRSQMAKCFLVKAGFRFEKNTGEGPSEFIYWPDGVRLTYVDGNIDYRGKGDM